MDERGFKIRFEPMGVIVEAHTRRVSCARAGRPGSLLDLAMGAGVPIDHACGGLCACSTCHVVVREGAASLSPLSEAEEDMLEHAPGLTPRSRLACRAVPDGSCDLVVEVPAWNRNLAAEEC